MKKKIMLTVLSVLALVACAGNETGSSSSSNGTSDVSSIEASSSVENVKDWTAEQKKLMQEHFYGVILPYIDIGEAEFDYDSDDGTLLIAGSNTLNQTDLQEYAKLYTAEDGWENLNSKYDKEYIFERKIQTQQGPRFVQVGYYVTDIDSLFPLDEGAFFLVASDPYIYEFPTAMFDAGIKDYLYLESEDHVPSFSADYYLINTEYPEVLCYTSTENADETYKTTLEQANFKILPEKDDGGATLALSPNGQFVVGYVYNAEYAALDIYIDSAPELPTEEWPAAGLKEAFDKYKQPEFTVPQMSFKGATYLGYEDEDNWQYDGFDFQDRLNYLIEVHNATETEYNTYITTTLTDASWEEDKSKGDEIGYKTFTKIIGRKLAKIDVRFISESSFVAIRVYLVMLDAPTEQWPTEEVKAAINNEYIEEQLPALESDKVTKYQVNKPDGYGSEPGYVEAYCEEADVDEVFNAYISLLQSSSWTANDGKWDFVYYEIDEETDYISPNKELLVDVKKNKGSVSILFEEAPIRSWPTKFVDKQKEKNGYTDVIPALEGNNLTFEYEVAPFRFPEDSFQISAIIDKSDNPVGDAAPNIQLRDKYITILTSAGYTKSERDETKLPHEVIYNSPSNQFEIILNDVGSDTLTILICRIVSE